MKKKIKLLSIGAAVMLLLLSAQAVAAVGGTPPDLTQQLKAYLRNYERERIKIHTYLESMGGNVPPTLPPEIQSAIFTLVQAMTPILSSYMVGIVTPGINGYWITSPPPSYTGYCISVAQGVVAFFDFMFTIGGDRIDPVDIIIAVETLFILSGDFIPLNVLGGLGWLLGVHWNTFTPWISSEESWNDFGLVWYFRKSVLIPWWGYEQWVQPDNFTPGWKYPQYTWVSG